MGLQRLSPTPRLYSAPACPAPAPGRTPTPPALAPGATPWLRVKHVYSCAPVVRRPYMSHSERDAPVHQGAEIQPPSRTRAVSSRTPGYCPERPRDNSPARTSGTRYRLHPPGCSLPGVWRRRCRSAAPRTRVPLQAAPGRPVAEWWMLPHWLQRRPRHCPLHTLQRPHDGACVAVFRIRHALPGLTGSPAAAMTARIPCQA